LFSDAADADECEAAAVEIGERFDRTAAFLAKIAPCSEETAPKIGVDFALRGFG